MAEGDIFPEGFEQPILSSEDPTVMTEKQAYYLHHVIDPEVDRLIANMELEMVRRELANEYSKKK